jgi:tetratricopeptide (TPR) repeat protein
MRGLTLLTLVAIGHPAWADRAAAEQLASEAERSHDDAAFVRCGQAYLDLYGQDPAAADADEVLYNAARCFESGKSISAALQADAAIIKSFPRSKLAARSLMRSGAMYEQIAFYDRAAERFEEYAKLYAGEKDAGDALADAIQLRAALGDVEKQVSDTKTLLKTFGAKRPNVAAAAQLALVPALEGDSAIAALRGYLKDFANVDRIRTILVHVQLADRLRAKSCPIRGVDHLCVKVVVDHAPRCGTGGASVVAVKRSAENREAVAEYRAAIAMFEHGDPQARREPASRHAQAMARLALADDDLETMIGTPLPHDLDLDHKDDQKRYLDWFDAEQRLGAKVSDGYSAILLQKDATSSVAAAERLGEASLTFWRALMLGEIPKATRAQPKRDAYCEQLRSVADPLRARAIEVFSTCIAKAVELDAGQEWADACWREGAQLDPVTFAAVGELRGAVGGFASPIALEPPVTSPPPPPPRSP